MRRPTKGVVLNLVLQVFLGGCTAESTRIAIESQQRANSIQQAVFERQQEGLRLLLYRDLLQKLEANGRSLSEAERTAISDVWNERDLVEFWGIQNERANALRMIGVDAKLFSGQATLDLLVKAIEAKVGRMKQGIASQLDAQLQQP